MLIAERHQQILAIVKKHKTISTNELIDLVFVSPATLRRDLIKMEKNGLIKRSFGAVSLIDSLSETSIYIRSQEQIKEKKQIANACMPLLGDNSSYFIDSSSTIGVLLQLFDRFKNSTIITNGIDNARILAETKLLKTYITPGLINYTTNSIIGIDAINYINSFNCNYFIFSCTGVNVNGINEANFEQNAIKKAMLTNSKTKILLVDHTKFDKIYLSKTVNFNKIDYIITDKQPRSEYLEIFKEANVNLIVTS
ncbi:MAG: DeoR/GlpR family DNA-binding transcription regulator [Bacilli bacterium]